MTKANAPALAPLVGALNPEQREAVTTLEGPLLVLAGAGTGKTRVITVRIAWMLAHGIAARNVLAVTFTNKAAGEMKERVGGLIGAEQAGAVTVGTFHALCARILREFAREAGLSSSFTIADESDQLSALRGALRELAVAEASCQPAVAKARISLAKNKLISPERYLNDAADDQDELVGRAWLRYEERLRRANSLDFDDLLVRTVELLGGKDAVRETLRKRFGHVLVDEYQDTNAPQYELLRLIAGAHRNLCVVGDDDQSIYGWRGADVRKILGFERDFPGAKVVRLETNYRSTEQILGAANAVIRNNPSRHEKTLRSHQGSGEPVIAVRAEDETAEADHVVREIAELVRRRAANYDDFAVLFRTGTQPRPFEQCLRARAVPYVLIGGMSYFDRKEVRDVLAFLKLLANPDDEAAFLRVINTPPRGIGKTTVERLLAATGGSDLGIPALIGKSETLDGVAPAQLAALRALRANLADLGREEPGGKLVERIAAMLDVVGYRSEVERAYPDPTEREARWAGVTGMLDFAENYVRRAKRPTLAGFLDELALEAEEPDDRGDHKRVAVTLMTLHAAKGLEFPYVYLVGLEEGLLPHQRAVEEDSIDEERRLCYVGITRARKRLTLSYAKSRAKHGHRIDSMPSRFLFELKGEKPPKGWQAARSSRERSEGVTRLPASPAKPARKKRKSASRG